MFGRATIRLGIGPHSSFSCFLIFVFSVLSKKLAWKSRAVKCKTVIYFLNRDNCGDYLLIAR